MENLFNIKSSDLCDLGIVDWGYSARGSAASWERFGDWLEQGKAGPLEYLKGERALKRKNLEGYYPSFASALVFLFDYSQKRKALESLYNSDESNGLKMASYVFAFDGEDYHKAIRRHLVGIGQTLGDVFTGVNFAVALDVHPVLERDLAWRCGLGWFGKNSMLINRRHGSFFLIGALLLDRSLNLPEAPPEVDHCGNCRACVDVCPTSAIDPATRTLDAAKCVSTFTVELFAADSPAPSGHPEKGGGEIFGCDLCQDVCPWNGTSAGEELSENKLADFFLKRPIGELIGEVSAMSGKGFARLFGDSVLGRSGKKGIIKNLLLFK